MPTFKIWLFIHLMVRYCATANAATVGEPPSSLAFLIALCYTVSMAKYMFEARIAPAKSSTKEERESGAMFSVGQNIVYPSQGVGCIKAIKKQDFRGTMMWYYEIYIPSAEMTVMAPVAHAGELGIRAIVSRNEAEAALATLTDKSGPITSDWKLRYQMNLDLLKKGTVIDIAAVVRTLFLRSKVKELPVMERKLYDSALALLQAEIAFALEMEEKEVLRLIMENMEPIEADKSAISDDDDDIDGVDIKDDEDEEEEKVKPVKRRRGRRSKRDDDDDFDF